MNSKAITHVKGTAVPIPGDDVDTDRIIPARFMKCLTFDGLGEFLFYDACRNEDGSKNSHPLNNPHFTGANIIIAGNNFGCGSSREHAPQSIYRAGFRAIIAEGFAEIFFGNCINLGMPCINASKETIEQLAGMVREDPATTISIDIAAQSIQVGQQTIACNVRDGARQALVEGRWDALSELLEADTAIETVGQRLGYV